MTDFYEFHIAGLITPVVRSGLPELVAGTGSRDTVLTGRVDDPSDIDHLLRRLDDNELITTHVVIARRTRWDRSLGSETGLPPGRVGRRRPQRSERRAGQGSSRMGRHPKLLDFEIRVTGRVPADVLDDIPGARLVARPVETILHGPVADQAALHRLVNRLQALGLDLLELRRISPSAPASGPLTRTV